MRQLRAGSVGGGGGADHRLVTLSRARARVAVAWVRVQFRFDGGSVGVTP
jgi:hypothetical protein